MSGTAAAMNDRRADSVVRMLNGLRRDWLRASVMAAAVAVVGWLVLYPLAILFRMGLHAPDGGLTLANYAAVVTEPGLSGALLNSLAISAATTAVSLLLALPIAWGVSRTRMPLRGFITICVTIAFVIPNFIGAIAWILLLGKNAGLLNVLARTHLGFSLFDIYSMGDSSGCFRSASFRSSSSPPPPRSTT